MGREEQIIENRIRKIKELKEQGINPYQNRFDVKNYSEELHEKYRKLGKDKITNDKVKIAGRIMIKRDLGKISFATLQDSRGKIQLISQEGKTSDKVRDLFKKYVDGGDFVGIEGKILRTSRGELSILIDKVEILSKAILPLPDKFHGIQNEDEIYRKRYLDIIMNPEVKELFIKKAEFWSTIRNFLLDKKFLEVETPILETSAGGATATPFKTHHNALDIDVFLRITMGELWQKKLMIAGYDKIFEIDRKSVV